MRHVFWHIYRASRATLEDRIMLAFFLALLMVLFSVMFTIPVRATLGNSSALQAQIFGAGDDRYRRLPSYYHYYYGTKDRIFRWLFYP